MVTDSWLFTMQIGSTELLFWYDFTCCCLHKWGTSQENCCLVLHHHDFVRHGWYVGTTCCAASHNYCDLRNSLGWHMGLVIKDTSKVFSVWENVVLFRQKGSSWVNNVNAWKFVLNCNLLRSEMLLDSYGKVSSSLVSVVVSNNHTLLAVDLANSCEYVSWRNTGIVSSKLTNFKERRPTIKNAIYSFHWRKLALLEHLLLFFKGDWLVVFNHLIELEVQGSHLIKVIQIFSTLSIEVFSQCLHVLLRVYWVIPMVDLGLKVVIKLIVLHTSYTSRKVPNCRIVERTDRDKSSCTEHF